MPVQNDPWYTRTEFWAMVGNVAMMASVVFKFNVPPAIGAGLASAGILVYQFGRGNVKANQASSALQVLGTTISSPPAK